ncbi:MAG: bifunctional hydroxymethylpyrimidine kinase/phosphomethylpyrimidine kinase [Promethearchaeota archaeon]
MKPLCLTIAGADPTSGAGIQADIRTFDRCGVYPFSVITAITYQTATQFYGYKSLSDELDKQLDSIFSVYPIKYVKIGMIPDIKTIDIIANYVKKFNLTVIIDPVSVASAGERLSSEGLELEIERGLFPLATIITPNITEAAFYSNKDLNNITVENLDKIKDAAEILLNKLFLNGNSELKEKAVVIKGAGSTNKEIFDLACIGKKVNNQLTYEFLLFRKVKIPHNGNVHGTGCIFSSAITAFLAKGNSIDKTIAMAEDFFDYTFQTFIKLPDKGIVIDLSLSDDKLIVINQIKEIYNYIAQFKEFSHLIPEVRMNISGSIPNPTKIEDVAGIEGRITIVDGFPKASGEIKFGGSDHTARLLFSAKRFDKSVNFVMNLKYTPTLIKLIQESTDLELKEIIRERQPDEIKLKEFSTMQWIIKESFEKNGKIPDIIWDKGTIGKEPMMRLFGKNSKDMIVKLQKIINLISN